MNPLAAAAAAAIRAAVEVGAKSGTKSSWCLRSAAVDGRLDGAPAGVQIGIAGGEIDDQQLAPLGARALEGSGDAAHSVTPRRLAIVPMSLSPRPDRLTTTSAPSRSRPAMAGKP